MLWSRRGNGIPLTWGHTRLSETDFRLITQESPGFICGECQIGVATTNKEAIGFDILNVAACTWAVFESIGPFPELFKMYGGGYILSGFRHLDTKQQRDLKFYGMRVKIQITQTTEVKFGFR